MIVKAMGLKPEEVVYAGDSEPDIITAHNGGMKSAACLWGYRDEETLRKLGPDVVANDPLQLLDGDDPRYDHSYGIGGSAWLIRKNLKEEGCSPCPCLRLLFCSWHWHFC